ncbi:Chromatin modification-related protein YNG2 [Wickerhamomyces ciferrii]|uniref:Chromatin modification-related protein YNG2 n=1 Tax=Wickerhamomyces ciferrii (strain ATCC 14091 / BCRC 22168 / CBS 111 / JCM 3599 / NBRC 0793 / NRRL Y-1031 F-60-10) TaxID=1206466 RepID=K0KLE0_WICCF|nr:Chromatin modification-related protein YNG2 [Wickerhamomyces ciferrii]CCH43027.1 Chromatin modification-related protein YNG2 [Wickerhamomyces ciferrii]
MSDFDVRSSFISVVDHLPSDIIRKLWLIQTLNISYETTKDELSMLLGQIQKPSIPRETYLSKVFQINKVAAKLRSIRLESLEEAKSINSTIKITKLSLQNQYSQLEHDQKNFKHELGMNGKTRQKVERSNIKRTSNRLSSTKQPKITLKLNLNPKPNSNQDDSPQKRRRGRPFKIIQPTTPERTPEPTTTISKSKKRKRGVPSKLQKEQQLEQEELQEEGNSDEDDDDALYCICRRSSFGEMIACDNPKCKYEWFHYNCVGLTRAPRGKWNCPPCKKAKLKMKK